MTINKYSLHFWRSDMDYRVRVYAHELEYINGEWEGEDDQPADSFYFTEEQELELGLGDDMTTDEAHDIYCLNTEVHKQLPHYPDWFRAWVEALPMYDPEILATEQVVPTPHQ